MEPVRHLPNLLSISRLLAVPVLAWLIVARREDAFFILLVIAWATDGLDGWLARRLDAVTRLGAVLDSVADVALIVVVLAAIRAFHPFVFTDHGTILWAIVALWSAVHVASLLRYGRTSSFHTRSAQAGIVLFAVFVVLLFTHGFVAPLYYTCGIVCLAAGVENAAIVWLLREWQPNVRGLRSALALRREGS